MARAPLSGLLCFYLLAIIPLVCDSSRIKTQRREIKAVFAAAVEAKKAKDIAEAAQLKETSVQQLTGDIEAPHKKDKSDQQLHQKDHIAAATTKQQMTEMMKPTVAAGPVPGEGAEPVGAKQADIKTNEAALAAGEVEMEQQNEEKPAQEPGPAVAAAGAVEEAALALHKAGKLLVERIPPREEGRKEIQSTAREARYQGRNWAHVARKEDREQIERFQEKRAKGTQKAPEDSPGTQVEGTEGDSSTAPAEYEEGEVVAFKFGDLGGGEIWLYGKITRINLDQSLLIGYLLKSNRGKIQEGSTRRLEENVCKAGVRSDVITELKVSEIW